ncbi:MAG: acyltransferase [Planktomarina sp.]
MGSTRFTWLDTLRLTAGLSMVGLHATTDPHGMPFAGAEIADRWAPLVLRAVFYTARTELFLIISAFLLIMSLDRRPRSYGQTIREQAERLLIPFVFWTVFFAFYSLIKAYAFGYGNSALNELGTPTAWLGFLMLGDVKYHMHFVPTLFGLLLFYPLFRLAVKHPWLGLLVLLGLVLRREADGFIWSNFYDHPILPWLLRVVKIVTYCGYGMLAGAAWGLWKNGARLAPWTIPLITLAAVLFGVKLYATYLTGMSGEWVFTYLPGYWADFLFPVILFLMAMRYSGAQWPAFFSKAAKYSFGIYLCHPIFLDIAEIALRDVTMLPIVYVLLKLCFAVPATVALVLWIERHKACAWTIGLGPHPFKSKNTKEASIHV